MTTGRVNGRAFWALLGASASSNLGDGIRLTAFPALAVLLTRDPMLVGGLTVAIRLPWLLFGLQAGVIVDRYDRRSLMIVTGAVRAATLVLLAVAVVADFNSIPLMYVVAFLLGMAEAVFDTSAQAIVPSLVDRQELTAANGRVVVAEIVGNEFGGPALGGLLFSIAVAVPFVVNAGLAVGSVMFLLAIQGVFRPERVVTDAPRSMTASVVVGARWLMQHRILRTVTVLGGTMAFLDSAAYAILVLYAVEVLGIETIGYGVLVAMSGVGGIIGSVAAGRVAKVGRFRQVMLASVAALGVALLGLGLTRDPLVAGVLWALAGCAYGLWGVVSVSLRQRLVPDHLLGRVGSAHRLVALGAAPIGALTGSVIASSYDLRTPFLFGGLVLAIAFVMAIRLLSTEHICAATAEADAAADAETSEDADRSEG